MRYRPLGATGIQVSEIAFGAGPVPALMTKAGNVARQRETIARAVAAGINWFDTAGTYGDGQSESALGSALREAQADASVNVATKVRLLPDQLDRIKENVRRSVRASLGRLGLERITLLQLHNSITRNRGDQPTSITARDVLGKNGVLEAFGALQAEGAIQHWGLTGLGDGDALHEVVVEGLWAAIQLCVDILHPLPQLLPTCQERGIGVIAIRVLAGGALAGQPPSAHTLTTKFFPLPIYEEDQRNAARLGSRLSHGLSLKETAIRFVLSQAGIATALIGLANRDHVEEAARFAEAGPLSKELLELLSHQAATGAAEVKR